MSDRNPSRRAALGVATGVLAAGCAGSGVTAPAPFAPRPEAIASDEAWWATVAAQYDVTREVIQLENANWGVASRSVMAAYRENLDRVNRDNSYYQRRLYAADMKPIAERTAALFGVSPDEIVFTRGATEALQALISGYNRLSPGDKVLVADADYDSMLTAMRWLRQRRGVELVSISLPEPASREGVLAAYADAFAAHPELKLALLTHLSHRSGLVIPVADIADMARARGIDVIVDAAHSFAQTPFRVPDLKADFVGLNLHKWVGAPIGVGAAYIRRERIPDIDPWLGEPTRGPFDIQARIHSGTVNFAAFLTIPAAIDFHEAVGMEAKAARLVYLRNHWAEAVRSHPRVEVLTPADPAMHAGITSFRLKGQTSPAQNIALAKRLLDEFGIFSVHRTGLAAGACVRIAPALFTSLADVEALRKAVLAIADSEA